jgi:hypothetical protein
MKKPTEVLCSRKKPEAINELKKRLALICQMQSALGDRNVGRRVFKKSGIIHSRDGVKS